MSFSSSTELTASPSLSDVDSPPTSTSEYGQKASSNKQGSNEQRKSRWRPAYHLQPTIPSWMNDPCAPFCNPGTGLYQISFQWNPNGPDWGDIAWATATSSDMIHWSVQEKPSLSPDRPYDNKGVFTGCYVPSDDGTLTYAYTSVSHLPIHHMIPHTRGSESLSLARSEDGGKTWIKQDCNPILPAEPQDLDVTGWRDPFVAKWPGMAEKLGLDLGMLFGIISGGIRDKTPTTFLYAIHPKDLANWTYLGPLCHFGRNFSLSRWSGDLGKNWEVSNFVTLRDENDPRISRDFIICGTEGCEPGRRSSDSDAYGPSRPLRQQLWFSGDLQHHQESPHKAQVAMSYNFGGHLDHGCLYAANSFFDPKTQRQIVWGWIGEEDLSDDLRHLQGWSGMLSMPRELRMIAMQHVTGTVVSDLSAISSVQSEQDEHGTHIIRTLSSQPYGPLIAALRQKPGVRQTELHRAQLTAGTKSVAFEAQDINTQHWELDATFTVSPQAHNIGLSIAHTADYSRTTNLFFDQPSETFVINRPALPVLNSSELINSSPEMAPHTLFVTRDSATGVKEREKLHVRAWRDSSVLEVFVNGRTAISTRLYAADDTFGMRFFVDDQHPTIAGIGSSELVAASLWDGIGL